MNSSFLFFGQIALVILCLTHVVALVVQFGLPRDTVRTLGTLFLSCFSLMLLTDALAWYGIHWVFYYPSIYGVLLATMGAAWPAFVWLGILDHPTQLHRKVLWRVPILGALAGHAMGLDAGLVIFLVGWLTGSVLILYHYREQRYVARVALTQAVVAFAYWIFIKAGILVGAQVCLAIWIILTHRIVNAFMVKNSLRVFSAESSEVRA
ncbi:MAG: hypothetical protein ACLGG7_00080 [Bacteriovoracia bacterium]